jgi:hypothetical protein
MMYYFTINKRICENNGFGDAMLYAVMQNSYKHI